ncbi:hypothetical protein YC2023_015692 [Brassica napus]
MQPDIWEEWWRPACVLDMQPAIWSTRCRYTCDRSHAKRHTGCHQPEADLLLYSINRHDLSSTEKASSVQSMILYDCEAEALSRSFRPRTVSSFDDSVEVMSGVSSCPRVQISRSYARYSAGKSEELSRS